MRSIWSNRKLRSFIIGSVVISVALISTLIYVKWPRDPRTVLIELDFRPRQNHLKVGILNDNYFPVIVQEMTVTVKVDGSPLTHGKPLTSTRVKPLGKLAVECLVESPEVSEALACQCEKGGKDEVDALITVNIIKSSLASLNGTSRELPFKMRCPVKQDDGWVWISKQVVSDTSFPNLNRNDEEKQPDIEEERAPDSDHDQNPDIIIVSSDDDDEEEGPVQDTKQESEEGNSNNPEHTTEEPNIHPEPLPEELSGNEELISDTEPIEQEPFPAPLKEDSEPESPGPPSKIENDPIIADPFHDAVHLGEVALERNENIEHETQQVPSDDDDSEVELEIGENDKDSKEQKIQAD